METKWLQGLVVRGEGRGKDLGFPTANIELGDNGNIPPEGVYAAWITVNDEKYMGAAHVGPRPTFDDARPTVEIHILDFPTQDIYGAQVQFTFVKKIREVEKFGTIPELVEAIAQDCQRVRNFLKK